MGDGESIEDLMSRGSNFIQDGDFQAAIEIGRQLQERRHTSAFEILALAYGGHGEIDKAVEVLEVGVQKGPSVWLLWQLLGNYRSDRELHEAAQTAYATALACPNVDASSVHLNRAVNLSRQGRYENALEALRLVTSSEFTLRAGATKADALVALGRFDEAIELGERGLAQSTDDIEPTWLAFLEGTLGRAYWAGRHDRDRALNLAWMALHHDRGQQESLWLVREVEHRVSSSAKYYRLLIEGLWDQPDEEGRELGFFTNYDVVADNQEEALEYARRTEPTAVQSSLSITEADEIEERPDTPCGVYVVGAYDFFPTDEED